MGGYLGKSMPELHQIATTEPQNVPTIEAGIKALAAAVEVLSESQSGISNANSDVRDNWLDSQYEPSFGTHIDAGLASLASSMQKITGANAPQAMQTLIAQIGTTAKNVQTLFEEWDRLRLELERLMKIANPGAIVQARIIQILKQMEALRLQAGGQVEMVATEYGTAMGAITAAGSGHSYGGPTSASGSSVSPGSAPSPTAARPYDTVTSFAPDAGQAGTTQADQLRQAQLDAAREGAEAGEAGDTGLAGGVATAPPATTIPPVSTPAPSAPVPTGTAPVGMPVAGAVPVGRAGTGRFASIPVAAAVGKSTTSIPQAAKMAGGITAASVGKAPVLPAESVMTGGTSRGSSFGPMGGAVPPMFGPLAGDKLQGLIGRLKPIVTQHGSGGESARVAGVPSALRGRSARPDVDDAFVANGPRARRSRKEQDDSPETLELLDEEIWQVEQPGPARTAG